MFLTLILFAVAVALAPRVARAEEATSDVVDAYEDNSDYRTTLTVSKVDATDGAAVAGAKLAIYKANDLNSPLVTWTTGDGSKAFERFLDQEKGVSLDQDQEYVLRELEAPEGYEKAEDTHFTLKSAGVTPGVFQTTLEVSGAGQKVGEDGIRLADQRSDNWQTVYKRSDNTTNTTTNDTSSRGTGNLAKTNDPTVMGPVLAIGIVGLVLVALALHRSRKKKD